MGAGGSPDPVDPNRSALDLSHRKAEHVKLVLDKPVETRYRYWNDIELIHHSLPDFDFEEVDPRVTLLGRPLAAPLVITGMTGGFPDATAINSHLARAAAELGLAMGVGSERAAIQRGQFPTSYSCVADHPVPLKLANIGAPQLIPQADGATPLGLAEARSAMELIGAHALAIHLNYLQEMVQPEGDRRARGCLDRIGELAREFPVLVKETGAGLSARVAEPLCRIGVRAFDVSGTGGTSFAAVEHYRALEKGADREARVGRTFWNWGIPSPVSVLEVVPLGCPVIASGGIRSGLDIARAIAMGATAAGVAGGVLRAAATSYEATLSELSQWIHELKVAMFLTGARTVAELQRTPYVVLGETRSWIHR
jgi:isopentenyl-diphosphate delta-isomerase